MKHDTNKLAQQNGPATIKMSEDHTLMVEGFLNFKHVVKLREKGKDLFKSQSAVINIDLTQVKGSDNSGLVLLVAWIRDAKHQGKSVNFRHIPDFLQRMAQVFGLQKILFKI